MDDGLPQGFDVISSDALQIGVCHNAGRVVAHHAVAVAGRTPFGQETAFLVPVGPTFLHLLRHAGVYQVHQGEEATECVPETCVCEEVAGHHLAVAGTVVYHLALGVNLIEAAGEEHGAVQTAVECAHTVLVAHVLYVEASQYVVPFLAGFFSHLLKRVLTHFAQVQFCLFVADEGRGHAHVHLFATLGAETDDAAGVLAFRFQRTGADVAFGYRCCIGKGLVKLQHKIVAEVSGHTAAVAGGIADNLLFFGNDFHV